MNYLWIVGVEGGEVRVKGEKGEVGGEREVGKKDGGEVAGNRPSKEFGRIRVIKKDRREESKKG